MISTQQSVVAVYEQLAEARRAVERLHAGGISAAHISLVAHRVENDPEFQAQVDHGDRTEAHAAQGAMAGGALGLLAGVAFFTLPAIGPLIVLGPLAAGLTGVAVGALVGAMTGWGIPEDQAGQYEQLIEAGQVLVIVHGDPLVVTDAHRLLEDTDPVELHLHAENSDDSPEIDDRQVRKPR